MAIFHLTTDHVKRSTGRTAVAAAAYRAGVKLKNYQDGITHDYRNRQGVLHTEIILPRDSRADWALNREKLWNAAEKAEKRKDSRTAREVEFALPAELNFEQQLELTREMCTYLSNLYGTAVDVAVHAPSKDGDQRNYHVHALLPTRTVEPDGLGNKIIFDRSDKWLREHGLPTAKEQLKDVRRYGKELMNHCLAKAGLDIRVDDRSHEERGLKIKPTKHVGVHATNMKRKGKEIHRKRLNDGDRKFNTTLIHHDPKDIFKIITSEKSVFDRRDIARTIHRYTDLSGQDFQGLFGKILASPELVKLQPETVDDAGNRIPAKYSTRKRIAVETSLLNCAEKLAGQSHKVSQRNVDRAIAKQDKLFQSQHGTSMTAEQREAVKHLTGPHRLSILVGRAGTGKSTLLKVAHAAWKSQGYRVIGAALSAKAADGLEHSSGIRSQTLSALERRLDHEQLQKNDLLVIDEAGMVDTLQLERIVAKVESAGAKVALIGDPEQLQPIGPGGGFRCLAEIVGSFNLTENRRQKVEWQAQASSDFATMRTAQALRTYALHNGIILDKSIFASIRSITRDYASDYLKSPESTRLALAHRRVDVKMLNSAIRAKLIASGHLDNEEEMIYETCDGVKSFARGDRVALLANNKKLGLKNGMLGTVEKIDSEIMLLKLDGSGDKVRVPVDEYSAFTHGYATTVHKSQGATVDDCYVLANKNMDRHLTYVAMSRHRRNAKMYASGESFKNMEDLFARLSRSRAKDSTLDYLRSFGERRSLDSDFGAQPKPHPSHWSTKEKKELSDLDYAYELLGSSMEEKLWLELHGAPMETLPEAKLSHAYRIMDKSRPGLSQVVKDTLRKNRNRVKELFIVPSGAERIAILKQAVGAELRLRKAKRSHQHTEPEPPSPTPSFGF